MNQPSEVIVEPSFFSSLLGVLSIDIEPALTEIDGPDPQDEDRLPRVALQSAHGERQIEIDWERLRSLLLTVQNVLESFSKGDRTIEL